MLKIMIRASILLCILILSACSRQPPAAAPPPTPQPTDTATPQPTSTNTTTPDASATAVSAMTATQDFRLTAFAATKTRGQAERLAQASTLSPRQTQSAESARSTATAVIRSFYETILNFERDGVIGSHEGDIIRS